LEQRLNIGVTKTFGTEVFEKLITYKSNARFLFFISFTVVEATEREGFVGSIKSDNLEMSGLF
jgi:hypothetical protein